MKQLREIITSEVKILSEKKNKDGNTMTILAPWIVGGRKNKNGRLYPLPLLQREVERVQAKIKSGSLIGSADHPQGAFTTLVDASHIIKKLEIDKDGKGWMEAEILPTTKGENVMTIIKAGGTLGISARGAGTISGNGTVRDDYRLLGIDLCMNPSEPEAVFNADNICESMEFEDKQEKNRKADMIEAYDGLLSDSYTAAVNDGFWYGDFSSYKEKFGKPVKEVLGLENDEKIKLTEEQKSAKIFSAYQESVTAGYRGSFNSWKKEFPNVVELVIKPNKVTEEESSDEEEKVKSAYQESLRAGFEGTFAEWKEKNPKLIEFVNKKEITREEFAEIESKRVGVTKETVLKKWEIDEKVKAEANLRKIAIRNVNNDLFIVGASISKEKRDELIAFELKGLKEQYKKD